MKNRTVPFLLFICCISISACNSTDFVYLDKRGFENRLLYLKKGYISTVFEVDPTGKEGYKSYGTPWLVLRESKFKEKNIISEELYNLILTIFDRKERYASKDWYPTYSIVVRNKGAIL